MVLFRAFENLIAHQLLVLLSVFFFFVFSFVGSSFSFDDFYCFFVYFFLGFHYSLLCLSTFWVDVSVGMSVLTFPFVLLE